MTTSLKLDLYQLVDDAPLIRPAPQSRAWMDETQGFAYRCLPLTIANTTGWEFLCPFGFTATWDGGTGKDALVVTFDETPAHVFASSHFGYGMLTLHPGYLIQTDAGVETMATGTPNHIKDGVQALTGVIATDWLPFPFTMNWRLTRPGSVRFEKGEPFCFITLLARAQDLAACQPRILPLAENPQLAAEYAAYAESRFDFNQRLAAGEPEALKASWQRNYTVGKTPSGREAPDHHTTKRRMKTPLGARPVPATPKVTPLTANEKAGYFVRPMAKRG